jgi:hypothetical protein
LQPEYFIVQLAHAACCEGQEEASGVSICAFVLVQQVNRVPAANLANSCVAVHAVLSEAYPVATGAGLLRQYLYFLY